MTLFYPKHSCATHPFAWFCYVRLFRLHAGERTRLYGNRRA